VQESGVELVFRFLESPVRDFTTFSFRNRQLDEKLLDSTMSATHH